MFCMFSHISQGTKLHVQKLTKRPVIYVPLLVTPDWRTFFLGSPRDRGICFAMKTGQKTLPWDQIIVGKLQQLTAETEGDALLCEFSSGVTSARKKYRCKTMWLLARKPVKQHTILFLWLIPFQCCGVIKSCSSCTLKSCVGETNVGYCNWVLISSQSTGCFGRRNPPHTLRAKRYNTHHRGVCAGHRDWREGFTQVLSSHAFLPDFLSIWLSTVHWNLCKHWQNLCKSCCALCPGFMTNAWQILFRSYSQQISLWMSPNDANTRNTVFCIEAAQQTFAFNKHCWNDECQLERYPPFVHTWQERPFIVLVSTACNTAAQTHQVTRVIPWVSIQK